MRLKTQYAAPVTISFLPEQMELADALAGVLGVTRSEVVRVLMEFGERYLALIDSGETVSADKFQGDELEVLNAYLTVKG